MTNRPANRSGSHNAPSTGKKEETDFDFDVKCETASTATNAQRGAAAAGAGTGTLFIVLAQNLPNQNRLKPWLILLAPVITTTSMRVWLRIRETVETYSREKAKRRLFRTLRETLLLAMDEPDISQEHRIYLRNKLEQLETLQVSRMYKSVKLLERN